MENGSTKHEMKLSNIYWTALFNLGAKTFMKSHLNFYIIKISLFFWKYFHLKCFEKTYFLSLTENKCLVIVVDISNTLVFNVMKCSRKISSLPKWEYNFMKFLTPISNGFCLHLSRMTQQNWYSTHVQHGSLNTTVSWQ